MENAIKQERDGEKRVYKKYLKSDIFQPVFGSHEKPPRQNKYTHGESRAEAVDGMMGRNLIWEISETIFVFFSASAASTTTLYVEKKMPAKPAKP